MAEAERRLGGDVNLILAYLLSRAWLELGRVIDYLADAIYHNAERVVDWMVRRYGWDVVWALLGPVSDLVDLIRGDE